MRQYYPKYGYRDNPYYPPDHCMTLTRCNDCGEVFEADREHICKKQNSYPWFENDDEDIVGTSYDEYKMATDPDYGLGIYS